MGGEEAEPRRPTRRAPPAIKSRRGRGRAASPAANSAREMMSARQRNPHLLLN